MLTYRPWLLGRARTLSLPSARHAIGRGYLYSELLVTDGEDATDILDFPPRYVGHESALAEALGLSEIRDVGLRAVFAWIRRTLGGGKPA
jgi:sulfur transfer protein SufE